MCIFNYSNSTIFTSLNKKLIQNFILKISVNLINKPQIKDSISALLNQGSQLFTIISTYNHREIFKICKIILFF